MNLELPVELALRVKAGVRRVKELRASAELFRKKAKRRKPTSFRQANLNKRAVQADQQADQLQAEIMRLVRTHGTIKCDDSPSS